MGASIMGKIALTTLFFALTCSTAALADQTQTAQPAASPQQATATTTQQQATAPAASTATTQTAATPTGSDKVCGLGYHNGQLINKTICITKSEQKFNKQQTHQNIRELQMRSLTSNVIR
jgi:hypothetical protein